VLDFNAIFDCEVTPTPSITPTNTPTPTVTPTPSTTPLCPFINVDVTITGYTPTPTPTLSVTPTPTPQVTRPCAISGTVSYNTIDTNIICPMSKQFQDCLNGFMYYTTSATLLPSGGTLSVGMVFKADVNGESKCISFYGINMSIIGVDDILLVNGPLVDCPSCVPDITPTPTVTPTPSVTPTLTPTPTSSVMTGFYTYKKCNTTNYVVQTIPGPTLTIGEVFKNTSTPEFNECWEYIGYSMTEPNLPLGSLITNYTGNIFPPYGFTYYTSCKNCTIII
jgi:hypothetical protein